MHGRKRGPYRQYLRQDEPLKSRSLQKKFRRRNKERKLTQDSDPVDIDDSADDCENANADVEIISLQQNSFPHSDNEFLSSLDCQGNEKFDITFENKVLKDPNNPGGISVENCEEVGASGCDYSSDSGSCSSVGTVYEFDSDNSTDGSAYDDCDVEIPIDNDPPLFEGAPLSLSSSILLTLSFVLKHRLTGQCFTDLLAVIEAHCPNPNHCKTSVRKLFDYFKNIKGNLVKHIFCSYCKGYVDEERQEEPVILPDCCKICGTSLTNNTSFFLEAPFVDQITQFCKG